MAGIRFEYVCRGCGEPRAPELPVREAGDVPDGVRFRHGECDTTNYATRNDGDLQGVA